MANGSPAIPYASATPAADERISPLPGARSALILLLAINLFNYVDRQVLAAVVPSIKEEFHASDSAIGWLATAFFVAYMIFAPLFGWLGDRMSRWVLVAIGVGVWSLATGGSGWARTFEILLLTRCVVGIGEAAYGPVAPTILSDLYPVQIRGRVLAWFYLAIPVGSALGYVLGGKILTMTGSWRRPFEVVVIPGIILGVWALFMRDPRQGAVNITGPTPEDKPRRARLADYIILLKTPSYVLDSAGMTAMTFAIGGMGFWMPTYVMGRQLKQYGAADLGHINLVFGAITVAAGFGATLLGGMAGDALRKRMPGSYFIVSGIGAIAGFPLMLILLFVPFPLAWLFIFLTVFCLFFNTGPTNTILANVTHPAMRSTAFALNIFIIHALGDVISPPVIGMISDHSNMSVAFAFVGIMFLVCGVCWLVGAKYLALDTELAPMRLAPSPERGFEPLLSSGAGPE